MGGECEMYGKKRKVYVVLVGYRKKKRPFVRPKY